MWVGDVVGSIELKENKPRQVLWNLERYRGSNIEGSNSVRTTEPGDQARCAPSVRLPCAWCAPSVRPVCAWCAHGLDQIGFWLVPRFMRACCAREAVLALTS